MLLLIRLMWLTRIITKVTKIPGWFNELYIFYQLAGGFAPSVLYDLYYFRR